MSLESLKQAVISERMARGTTDGERLDAGLRVMPENKMHLIIQQLHDTLIPKVKASRGEGHADTKFFEDTRDCLVWALHCLGRYDDMQRRLSELTILKDYLFQRTRLLEKELDKHQALEDVILSATFEDYKGVIREKILNLEKVTK
jgi:hypothetical protein